MDDLEAILYRYEKATIRLDALRKAWQQWEQLPDSEAKTRKVQMSAIYVKHAQSEVAYWNSRYQLCQVKANSYH